MTSAGLAEQLGHRLGAQSGLFTELSGRDVVLAAEELDPLFERLQVLEKAELAPGPGQGGRIHTVRGIASKEVLDNVRCIMHLSLRERERADHRARSLPGLGSRF